MNNIEYTVRMLSLTPEYLLQLGTQYGLPLYVYDASVIARQVGRLQNGFSPLRPRIHYACKALNTVGIIQYIHHLGCGIDTTSPGEMTMALKAGVPPEHISFTPSGVHTEDYVFAIERGIHIHVDQLDVLQWLDVHYPGTSVTLRFNPGVEAGSHEKLRVGASGSKFGFAGDQMTDLISFLAGSTLRVVGVHMHLGSDISDEHSFDTAYSFLLTVAMHWKETLEHVDVGGGFKVPYHEDDAAIDLDSFGKKVIHRFETFCNTIGRPVDLILEPGKYLVSEAGYFLMEVSSVREAGHTDMIYLHSGFNHFVRPMNYDAYHQITNLSNLRGEPGTYDIVGYLCETDTFALQRTMATTKRGDIVCLHNAGAYGMTMASNYNGRPRPAEVLVVDGKAKLIRRAETLEDILQTHIL